MDWMEFIVSGIKYWHGFSRSYKVRSPIHLWGGLKVPACPFLNPRFPKSILLTFGGLALRNDSKWLRNP